MSSRASSRSSSTRSARIASLHALGARRTREGSSALGARADRRGGRAASARNVPGRRAEVPAPVAGHPARVFRRVRGIDGARVERCARGATISVRRALRLVDGGACRSRRGRRAGRRRGPRAWPWGGARATGRRRRARAARRAVGAKLGLPFEAEERVPHLLEHGAERVVVGGHDVAVAPALGWSASARTPRPAPSARPTARPSTRSGASPSRNPSSCTARSSRSGSVPPRRRLEQRIVHRRRALVELVGCRRPLASSV